MSFDPAPDQKPLSDKERAELDKLRQEKAARDQQYKAAKERLELKRLQEEKARVMRDAHAIAKEQKQRERGRKLMEPDEEDLHMPIGQKLVLAAVFVIALVLALSVFF